MKTFHECFERQWIRDAVEKEGGVQIIWHGKNYGIVDPTQLVVVANFDMLFIVYNVPGFVSTHPKTKVVKTIDAAIEEILNEDC